MAGFPFSSLSITSEVIIQARQEPEELVRFVGRGFLHRRQMPMLGMPNLVRRMTAEIAAQMSIVIMASRPGTALSFLLCTH